MGKDDPREVVEVIERSRLLRRRVSGIYLRDDLMPPPPVRDGEIDDLLTAIYQRSGFDFRSYARSSLERRILKRVVDEGLPSVTALHDCVLASPDALDRLLADLSINVTSMFRDPSFWRAIRRSVVPLLRKLPFVRIWHPGCATGEEVYSMAIVLAEEGLLDRARLYATDIKNAVLNQASRGVFPLENMREYTGAYLAAGGAASLSNYYRVRDDAACFSETLRDKIVFGHHNLVTDPPLSTFDLVLCRNVLIYFDQVLKDRVLVSFDDCLFENGFLCFGRCESLRFSAVEDRYDSLDAAERIYRRRG
jgi:chemotaxis protein methyltransferase CheR